MKILPDRMRLCVADCSSGTRGEPDFVESWEIHGNLTEDEADALLEHAYESKENIESRVLAALEELSIGDGADMPALIAAVRNPRTGLLEEHAVRPEHVEGIYKGLLEKYRELGEFSNLQAAKAHASELLRELIATREDALLGKHLRAAFKMGDVVAVRRSRTGDNTIYAEILKHPTAYSLIIVARSTCYESIDLAMADAFKKGRARE